MHISHLDPQLPTNDTETRGGLVSGMLFGSYISNYTEEAASPLEMVNRFASNPTNRHFSEPVSHFPKVTYSGEIKQKENK